MKPRIPRISTLFGLGAALLLWGCGDLGDPAQILAPSEAALGKGATADRLKLVEASQSEVTGNGVLYELIDRHGGVVGNAAYRVEVPRGAVDGPTLFVIGASTEYANNIVIKATATSCPSGDKEACFQAPHSNDIGGPGFKKPVEIFLGFNPRGGHRAWQGVTIVLIREDGELVRIPTNVRKKEKELRGITDHFSLYGIGWP